MAMLSRRHSQLPRGQSSKDLVARVLPAFLVGAILCAHEVCQLWTFAKLSPCENHRNTMITYTTASCALFNTGFRVTPATCPRIKLHPSCSHTPCGLFCRHLATTEHLKTQVKRIWEVLIIDFREAFRPFSSQF